MTNVVEILKQANGPAKPLKPLLKIITTAQANNKKIVFLFQSGAGALAGIPVNCNFRKKWGQAGFSGCTKELEVLGAKALDDIKDIQFIVISAMTAQEAKDASSARAPCEGESIAFVDDPNMLLASLLTIEKNTVLGQTSSSSLKNHSREAYAPEAWVLDSEGNVAEVISGVDVQPDGSKSRKDPNVYINSIVESCSNTNDNKVKATNG